MKKENIKSGVYFIKNDYNNQIKIGCSNNISRRFGDLKKEMFHLGLNFNLTLLGAIYDESYYDIENYFHNKYKSKRNIGEWFSISELEVIDDIENFNMELISSSSSTVFEEVSNDDLIIISGFSLCKNPNIKKCNLTISETGVLYSLFEIGNFKNSFTINKDALVDYLGLTERNMRKYLSKFSKLGILIYENYNGDISINISNKILKTYEEVV